MICSRCKQPVAETTGILGFPELVGHPVVCAPCIFLVLTGLNIALAKPPQGYATADGLARKTDWPS